MLRCFCKSSNTQFRVLVVQKALPPDFVANRRLSPFEPLEIKILDPELGFPFWGWTGPFGGQFGDLNANPKRSIPVHPIASLIP